MLELLILASIIFACCHIYFDWQHNNLACYVFKPLTVLCMIVYLFINTLVTADINQQYAFIIIAGLLFSLAGDCFLMLKPQKFIAGLISFLIAHILYCIGFYQLINAPLNISALWIMLIPALGYYGFLYGGLGKLKIPVAVYVSAILSMTFLSFNVYEQQTELQAINLALFGFVGALFFMLSDSLLALNKFKRPFKLAQPAILSTYYLAQWLIVKSV